MGTRAGAPEGPRDLASDPIPHPDHIVIDMQTGRVRIEGPFTKEEKVVWDEFHAKTQDCDREIAYLEDLLKTEPDHPHRDILLNDLNHEKRLRAIVAKVIPD